MNTLLTKRHKELSGHLILGLTNAEIGRRMGIKEKTVKYHLSEMYRRTETKNKTHLAIKLVHFMYRARDLEDEIDHKESV